MGAQLSYPTVDLCGKVAIVTGGNTGIGYETAKALAVMGAQTIIACRSEERATQALGRLREEVAMEFPECEVRVESMTLDLASFHSTKQFVSAFQSRNLPLHIFISNAGIAWPRYSRTVDGFESQFQVNHLSPFLLTLELLPTLLESAAATGDGRIVIVSSRAHSRGVWDPTNMNAERSYSSYTFYNNSKLYNVMMAYALQRRLKNVGITVSSLHPGVVNTELFRNLNERWYTKPIGKVAKHTFRNPKDGAATTINCAVNPHLNSQQAYYYADCRPKEPSATARTEQLQEQLWEISVGAVGEYLSPEVRERFSSAHPKMTKLSSMVGVAEEQLTDGKTKQSHGQVEQDDEKVEQDDGQVEEDGGKVEQDDGKVEEDDGQVEEDDGKVEQDDGKVEEDDGQVEEDDGKVEQDDGKVEEDDGKVEQHGGKVEQDDGQVEQHGGKVEQDGGKVEQDDGQVEQDDGKVEEDDGQVEQDDGKVEEDDGQVEQHGGKVEQDDDRIQERKEN